MRGTSCRAPWAALSLGAFGIASLLAFPSMAGAGTVGVPTGKLDSTNFGRVCGGASCTFVNDRLSAGRVRAPETGTITRWRANVGEMGLGTGPVEVRLQVLRLTANEPGVAADEYVAIRESASSFTTTEGINQFDASLKIRKGDLIGLAALGDEVEVYGRDGVEGNRELIFAPPFIPGDAAQMPDTVIQQERIAFNATIKD